MARALSIDVEGQGAVSGLLELPDRAVALFLFAHGAGAGLEHRFMARMASELAERGVGTLRFNFPFIENGGFPPDRPPVATAAVRAAVDAAREEAARFEAEHGRALAIVAGGKSFGARMTSTAAADAPLPDVARLVFLGWPLHTAKKPGTKRAEHLADVTVPMLFVQGTRDRLAELDLLRSVVEDLERATLHVVEGGDHSFEVLKRSGRTQGEVMAEIGDAVAGWVADAGS